MSPVRSALSTLLPACAMFAAVVTTGLMVTAPPPDAALAPSVPTAEHQALKHVVQLRRDHVRNDGWSPAEVEALETKTKTRRIRRQKIDLGDDVVCDWGF